MSRVFEVTFLSGHIFKHIVVFYTFEEEVFLDEVPLIFLISRLRNLTKIRNRFKKATLRNLP